MIEEAGQVVEVDDDKVWVETVRSSACDTCKAQKGCGHGLINKAAPGQTIRIAVEKSGFTVQSGDWVTFGVPEDTLVKASIIGYLMPIVLLIVGALAGKLLLGETGSVLFGIGGLVVGFYLVRKLGRSALRDSAPIILSVQPSK